MGAYSVVYSTAEVFLHSRNQKQPSGVLCKKGVKNVQILQESRCVGVSF